jgi:ATP-binding cassette, subfamily B, bacterial
MRQVKHGRLAGVAGLARTGLQATPRRFVAVSALGAAAGGALGLVPLGIGLLVESSFNGDVSGFGIGLLAAVLASYWALANVEGLLAFRLVDECRIHAAARTARLQADLTEAQGLDDPRARELEAVSIGIDTQAGGPRQLAAAVRASARLVVLAVVAVAYSPYLLFAFALGFTALFVELRAADRTNADIERIESAQLAGYQILTGVLNPTGAIEQRVFGAFDAPIRRFENEIRAALRHDLRRRLRSTALPISCWLLYSAVLVGVLVFEASRLSETDSARAAGLLVVGVILAEQLRQAYGEFLTAGAKTLRAASLQQRLAAVAAWVDSAPRGAESSESPNATDNLLIGLDEVGFRFPDGTIALSDVSLTVRMGESVAIVGPNGSGKSTLADILLGLRRPTTGLVVRPGPAEAAAPASAVFQAPASWELLASDSIGIGDVSHLGSPTLVEAAIHRSGTESAISRLPDGLETRIGSSFVDGHELSLGERHALAIARSRMRSSGILLMDEPSASLDPIAEYNLFLRTIESVHAPEGGNVGAIVVITHRLAIAAKCDRVVMLDRGSVVADSTHNELMQISTGYRMAYLGQARGVENGDN